MRRLTSHTSLVTFVLGATLAGQVMANPQDGVVSAGSAAISQAGKTLTVNQSSDKAVIDWRTFNIGVDEHTQFVQPSASAMTLNRVSAGNPSQILGSLTANGNIILVNPSGIMFGKDARVDVNGLVATTSNISNSNFMAGTHVFDQPGDAHATIENHGLITAKEAGLVGLVAPEVANHGIINARLGKVQLASGDRFTLDMYGDGLINVGASDAVQTQLIQTSGTINAEGGTIALTAAQGAHAVSSLITVDGELLAPSVSQKAGKIVISGDTISNTGTISVSGSSAGEVDIHGRAVMQQGKISADNSTGSGGKVAVGFTKHYLDSESSSVTAKGTGGSGGTIHVAGDTGSNAFISGNYNASSTGAKGGKVAITAAQGDLKLFGSHVTANGTTGGGDIAIGGDYQGGGTLAHAATTGINFATVIRADALDIGTGGNIIVWSDESTKFAGSAFARGGINSGNGGRIEVSSNDTLLMSRNATTDASAAHGAAGQLLLDPKNITIATGGISGGISSIEFIEPNPDGNIPGGVGALANGNVVRVDSLDSFAAANAGAVYLYNGTTGALISTLTGTQVNDQIGSTGFTELSNGNFVIQSANWANGTQALAGAATWASGTTGISGVVNVGNSLVGSTAGDAVGQLTALANGNYVLTSTTWDNGSVVDAGAVTWANGTTGTSGVIGAGNSLVGSTDYDKIGEGGIIELTNHNYVVRSYNWDNAGAVDAGAVTWASGTAPTTGPVSVANSLVGSTTNDNVGYIVRALKNDNYVVGSFSWTNGANAGAGAVTWGNGTTGTSGTVNTTNSLYGTKANDGVGNNIVALPNGNYVITSPTWGDGVHTEVGAVTWGDGTMMTSGPISAANSFVGSHTDDHLGFNDIVVLSNGNYVIPIPEWDDGVHTDVGAVTWGNGATGSHGVVSAANSLVGSSDYDFVGGQNITALNNGNYVVGSAQWDNGTAVDAGAVTWGNGLVGTTGPVSVTNSLVGTHSGDKVGNDGITKLSDGNPSNHNYVVSSRSWSDGVSAVVGAVTWGNGAGGTVGAVDTTNSFVGSSAGDAIGHLIYTLTNGNYVVASGTWSGGAGAVTWGNGATGSHGVVSAANSLVGSTAGDSIGDFGFTGNGLITLLSNGNYVVNSPDWDNAGNADVGAVTWGNGLGGTIGTINAGNSVIGSTAGDAVGTGTIALANGNYVIGSSNWDNGGMVDAGAVTWGNGLGGTAGTITAAHSIVGSHAGDQLSVATFINNQFLVTSSTWDNGAIADAGAIGIFAGTGPATGTLNATNAFIGTSTNEQISVYGTDDVNGRVLAYDAGPMQHLWSIIPAGSSLGSYDSYADQSTSSVTLDPSFITNVLNAGTNVTLQASNDITLTDALSVNNGTGNGGTLTLQAGRSIFLNNSITTDNGNLNIFANERLATGVVNAMRDAGAAVINMALGTTIHAGTGDVNVRLDDGAGKTNSTGGNITLAGTINANSILVNNQNTTGDVVLASGAALNATATSGDSIILASKRNFTNQVGAGVLSTAGTSRWLSYSTAPGSDAVNSLSATFTRYSCIYGGSCPALGSGNGFLYANAAPGAPAPTTSTPTEIPNTVLYVSQTPVPNIVTPPLYVETITSTKSNAGQSIADIRDNKSRPGLWEQRTPSTRLVNIQDWLSIDPVLVREFALDYSRI